MAQTVDAERELIERAQRGDRAAFEALFRTHRGDVARVVHRVLGPSGDLEDVVQEVFVHVHRSLSSFRFDSKFRTWLYRLALNVARMQIRRAKARPRIANVEVPETSSACGTGEEPEEGFLKRERVRALYRLLERLPEKKREVLILHDLTGVNASELAELLAIPVLTVRTRLFYARKELYALLASEPELAAVVRDNSAGEERESRP